ncbi:Loganic acid O-methyltransferase [Linum grandiflorum]
MGFPEPADMDIEDDLGASSIVDDQSSADEHYFNQHQSGMGNATKSASEVIEETILDKMDAVRIIHFTSPSNVFRVADLGCSTGPKSLHVIDSIVDAIKSKITHQTTAAAVHLRHLPEFQVFFNDLPYNDFNSLFATLLDHQTDHDHDHYFAAGVAGSFHGRLFPASSVHFVHCAYSLQWMSPAPEGGREWNRRRIHYVNAGRDVYQAYKEQFGRDVGGFLEARAMEIVEGGFMAIVIPSMADGGSNSVFPLGLVFNHLGTCLLELSKEGIVSEADIDSFNIPMYVPTEIEMRDLIRNNGCFSIERAHHLSCNADAGGSSGLKLTTSLRGSMEGFFTQHFGSEVVDHLFDRCFDRIDDLLDDLATCPPATQLTIILKRS